MASKHEQSSIAISIVLTLAVAALLTYLTIYVLGEYGFMVFMVIPFSLGFLPGTFMNIFEKEPTISFKKLGIYTYLIANALMVILLLEGAVCLVMAAPITYGLMWLGTWVVSQIKASNKIKNNTAIILFCFTIISGFAFDSQHDESHHRVESEIIINAPIETVWNNVVTFDTIDDPLHWLFTKGIAYPTHATIKGTGVGAIRYCTFNTGSFVEPITVWDEPNILAFDVVDQPSPMNELNPFGKIEPPHLHGYFGSEKGQFKLEKINENQTKLIGTTWYKLDYSPEFYWEIWTNFIIHKIHDRVLNHIKVDSETINKIN